jgi:hypothetical protein
MAKASARDLDAGDRAVAFGNGDDGLDQRAAVDDLGLRIAGDRARAERGGIGVDLLQDALLDALRGCGPPNRAWSACTRGSDAPGSAWPGRGGVRLNSGGITSSGARVTANSSGRSRPKGPPPAQAVTSKAAGRAIASARIM